MLILKHVTRARKLNDFIVYSYYRFCTRQRQIKPGGLAHRLEPSSVKINPHGITAVIHTEDQNHHLSLDVTYNQHSIFRVLIDELTDEYKRYRVPTGDVLPGVEKAPIRCKFADNSLVLDGQSGYKAVVYYNPFHIDFFLNDIVVASANKRSLLNFEHQRKKPIIDKNKVSQNDNHALPSENHEVDISTVNSSEDSSGNTDVPKDSTTDEDKEDEKQDHIDTEHTVPEDQSWSEYFKEHLDTRPHGLNSISMDFDFQGFSHVYGIPEHADGFVLKTTSDGDPYRLYNLDVFEYEVHNKMALYGSVPVMWGHNQNNTVGVLWLNPSETWIDIDHSNSQNSGIFSGFFSKKPEKSSVQTRWISESGLVDLYVFMGSTPSEAMRSYASVVGTTKLPPLFAIGYHQCRWNYNDEADLLSVDKHFDEYEMPVDVLWLDIEHTDGKRYFTWDRTKFPNPKEMVDKLNVKGRKLVTVVDPHIKRDSNWPLFR